ncbi:hypothetical protein K469DRAFT_186982 [Zopfia rhizophila CBS 207.26]|uniref:Uncharacterized protein n=1 Tax=Zopfia rhizophila CBS 207.26 TaxID=1314779 RepID=A0A6A6ES95_9PEZI|nr:hypothetical protein K469DRAFT_186982 [Zopfia rhizophila CBS 207.26]
MNSRRLARNPSTPMQKYSSFSFTRKDNTCDQLWTISVAVRGLAFLWLSPLNPRTRGRHGGCYPAWGVPADAVNFLQGTLAELGNSIWEDYEAALREKNATKCYTAVIHCFRPVYLRLKEVKGRKELPKAPLRTTQTLREETLL